MPTTNNSLATNAVTALLVKGVASVAALGIALGFKAAYNHAEANSSTSAEEMEEHEVLIATYVNTISYMLVEYILKHASEKCLGYKINDLADTINSGFSNGPADEDTYTSIEDQAAPDSKGEKIRKALAPIIDLLSKTVAMCASSYVIGSDLFKYITPPNQLFAYLLVIIRPLLAQAVNVLISEGILPKVLSPQLQNILGVTALAAGATSGGLTYFFKTANATTTNLIAGATALATEPVGRENQADGGKLNNVLTQLNVTCHCNPVCCVCGDRNLIVQQSTSSNLNSSYMPNPSI